MATCTISYNASITQRHANSNSGASFAATISAPSSYSAYTKVTDVSCTVPLHSDLDSYPSGSFYVTLPNGSTTSAHTFTMHKSDGDYNEIGSWSGRSDEGCLSGGVYTVNISISGNIMSWFHYWISAPSLTLTYISPTVTVTPVAGPGGTVSGGGTVTIERNDTPYTTTITATPNIGYHFVQWSDGNTNASRTITISESDLSGHVGSAVYTAQFALNAYETTISASVTTLNSGRNGTVSETAPEWLTVYLTDTNGDTIANGSYITYGSTVQFHAPAAYVQSDGVLVLDRFEWSVGISTGTVLPSDNSIGRANDGSVYFEYEMGSISGPTATVVAVYERSYLVQITASAAATVHSNFDATERSVNHTWVTYMRTATQLATTNGVVTVTLTNASGYGIRAHGNGSEIPESCVLASGYSLQDQVTVWQISPPNVGTMVSFGCYQLHHTVSMTVNGADGLGRITLARNGTPISLAQNQFTSSNGVLSKTWTVDDGDTIVFTENKDGSSRFSTSTTITTTMQGASVTNNFIETTTYSNVVSDIAFVVDVTVVQYTVSANQPLYGTTTVAQSPCDRTGTVNVLLTYEDAMMPVAIYDTVNGSTQSLIALITGGTITHTVNGQTETLSYANDVLTISNIQQNHSLRFELSYDWRKWLYIYTIGYYPASLQIAPYYSNSSTPAMQCALAHDGDATVRRDIYAGYYLSVAPLTHYELVGCAFTLLVDLPDFSESVAEYSDTVFTSSESELNNALSTFLDYIVPGDGYAYTLVIEPVFRINRLYMTHQPGQTGERRPKTLWYIGKNGVTSTLVRRAIVTHKQGGNTLVYGIVDTNDDDQWTDAYADYINSTI